MLKDIYKKWESCFFEIKSERSFQKLNGPFLANESDKYLSCSKRMVIFGQQTCGWSKDFIGIRDQMEEYKEFNFGANYRNTPFWSAIRFLEKEICGIEYSSMWLNLNRYDMDKRRPEPREEEIISMFDSLICEEIKVLDPLCVIFLTGPLFDTRLNSIFEQCRYVPIHGYNTRHMCKIEHPSLPKESYRTYHPGYLRRKKWEKQYLSTIVNEIQSSKDQGYFGKINI